MARRRKQTASARALQRVAVCDAHGAATVQGICQPAPRVRQDKQLDLPFRRKE